VLKVETHASRKIFRRSTPLFLEGSGLVFRGESFTHSLRTDRPRWISFQRVISRPHLSLKPALDGAITSQKCPKPIANHLAFRAYSPVATLDLIASAISVGKVMLNCWVLRMCRLSCG
jgi:hypothetical protein